MIKTSLERFDSPIVIINQVYKSEDWGVVASYVSKQDAGEEEDEVSFAKIGWHLYITHPNLNETDFDQVFGTLEAALEFGVDQIICGDLESATSPANGLKGESHPFGHYNSIVPLDL
ncbi:MAG: hypothetical protein RPU13_01060 [Candidatus Sedimenticola sp. (ex Thyasira tokunagai)]